MSKWGFSVMRFIVYWGLMRYSEMRFSGGGKVYYSLVGYSERCLVRYNVLGFSGV